MVRHTPRPITLPVPRLIQRLTAVLLIIAATLLVYWPALRNGFVWDDTALVLRDPLIRSWRLIPEGFRHFLFIDATGSDFYRPMQRLSFTIDYCLSAFKPADWHFTSMAVHAAAATALYALLRRCWGREQWLWALGTTLVWAIHPIHTSAVTYVAGRADPLAAFFAFTGLTLALSGTARGMGGAAACFFGALLSKESGAMALAIWFVFLAAQGAGRAVWMRWGSIAVVVFAAYFALRTTAHRTPPPPSTQLPSTNSKPVLVARAVAEYAGLIAAPVTLRMERDIRDQPAPHTDAAPRTLQTIGGVALIALSIAWWLWARRRRQPAVALALLAGAVAYFPISNVFTLNATVAEHWLYIPSAFLLAAAAQTLRTLPPLGMRAAVLVISLWSAWLGVRTWQRQADWMDQRTFVTRTIEAGGDSARMHVNLAHVEYGEGRFDRALQEYDAALQRNPTLIFAHFGRATVLGRIGEFDKARAALDQCPAGRGFDAQVLQMRAALDSAEKRIDPAPAYKAAADLQPLNWSYRKRYLTTLADSGRLALAISELRAFLDQQSFRADSWLLLATYLARTPQRDFATIALREARARDVHLQASPPAAGTTGPRE
jgi:tetratricopeptide (TPR) repeat protein